jgi:tRNA-2-methylthio-N6-dimethylallyladenosine synthase
MNYIIKTFGCQMNFSDSERIMTFMKENGFTPLDNSNDSKLKTEEIVKADLIIFNTCGIRASSEHRVFGQINNIVKLANKENLSPKIIVTGCSAHRDDFQKAIKGKVDLFTSIKDFPKSLRKLNLLQEEQQEYEDYLAIQPNYKYTDTAMVPIMTGCNNFCAYCVVPYARGREWSRPLEEIIKEISELAKRDYKEVTLLGQNVNSYKTNLKFKIQNLKSILNDEILNDLKNLSDDSSVIDVNFPMLLNILARQFSEITFKFLTSHPKDCSMELIRVIKKNKNIPNELHLPIQAGSDKVLKDMNRPYTQQYYLDLIKAVRKIIPTIKITTDIIIGFPTETNKDFLETVKVFKKVGFSKAFLNKYSPRPGTKAFDLGDPIEWKVKKERERKLLDILSKNQETHRK